MSLPLSNEALKQAARREGKDVARLKDALKDKRLVIIVGAGVTLSATADKKGIPLQRLTWTGLIRNGLEYLIAERYMDTSNPRTNQAYEALKNTDTDSLLDAANTLSSQLTQHGQFPTWLETVFGNLDQEIRHPAILEVLKALHEKGATLLTTNYDDLLEKTCNVRRIGRSNREDILRFRRDLKGIFHVHGSYQDPDEVVLDSKDYYRIRESDEVQNLLKSFLDDRTILFVGCGSGLEDPNFDALLKWASERHKNLPNIHCLLIRNDDTLDYRPLVRLKYGASYQDLVPYLYRLLDDPSPQACIVNRTSTYPGRNQSILPFGRDEDFVGREEIIKKIEQVFSESQSLRRVALEGLGGVGKSQIAIEYAYRLWEKSPDTRIFWVHAGSSARFEQSYRSIANAAKLPGADEPKIDILDLVFRWLENDDSGTWLMIVDNADDSAVFFPRVPASMTQISDQLGRAAVLSTYLPKRSGGSILITSRNRDAAFQLVGRLDRIINVKQFEEVDAKTLLRKKLPNDPSDEGDWNTLIDALECLPLAITQAAAYIAMRSPRMTVAKYLKHFRRSELNQISLLSENRADLRRDPEIPNAVVMTWQISFDQIRLQYPSAADLLARMSILDRQGIPKFLICHHKHEDGDEDEDGDDGDDDGDLEFEDAIGTLIGFSFVNSQEDGYNFEMHPLVQLSTRKWLEIHEEIEQRKEEALSLLSQKFPNGEHANWTICEALEPHAQIVLRYQSVSQGCRLKRANILHNSAWFALNRGSYMVARGRIQETVRIREELLGPNNQDTLASYGLLASTMWNQGLWKEAEELNMKVMETKLEVLGEEHPDTLISMANLASTYRIQGRWKEAEELNMKVIETSLKVLGKEHQTTLLSMANLASTYRNQGRWKEAEKLFVKVIETRLKVLGEEHPSTLTSMANLASTMWNQGRWKEAEELFVKVTEMSLKVLGEEHPSTLSSMANLAYTWKSQGRDEEAIELLKRVERLKKQVLGSDHYLTINSTQTLYEWQMPSETESAKDGVP